MYSVDKRGINDDTQSTTVLIYIFRDLETVISDLYGRIWNAIRFELRRGWADCRFLKRTEVKSCSTQLICNIVNETDNPAGNLPDCAKIPITQNLADL